jgi:galactitol-specific phosphotransferase system IIC component
MEGFLTGLKMFFDTLCATVLLPIIIFIIAVIMGAKLVEHPRRSNHRHRIHWHQPIIGLMWSNLSSVVKQW